MPCSLLACFSVSIAIAPYSEFHTRIAVSCPISTCLSLTALSHEVCEKVYARQTRKPSSEKGMVIKLKTIKERAPGNWGYDAVLIMLNRGVIKARTLEASRKCRAMLPLTDHGQ